MFFVAMSETTHPGSRACLSDICQQQAGFTPKVLQNVELESDLLLFVAEGLGVTLARRQIKNLARPSVVFRPLAVPLTSDDWIVWHPAKDSKALQQYIEIVKKVARSGGETSSERHHPSANISAGKFSASAEVEFADGR